MTLRSYGFGTAAGETKILDEVDKMAVAIRRSGRKPIDPGEVCIQAATCTTFGLVLGTNFTYEDLELKRILQAIGEWILIFMDKDFQTLDKSPGWLSSFLVPTFKKKVFQSTNAYRKVLLRYIKPHIEQFHPDNPRDVVDGYLKERGVDQFDSKKMADNIITMTVDALINVTNVLRAILFYVAKHPDVQSRVQAQLDAVVGHSRQVTTKDKSSLPLVDAVIYETLRIMTPLPFTPLRETPRDTTLVGYHIPKGTQVMANIWGIHMNPETYKDPEHFCLEHFLEEDGSVVRSPEALVPFGMGKDNQMMLVVN